MALIGQIGGFPFILRRNEKRSETKITGFCFILPLFLSLTSCRQPVFEYDQPPFVLHRYHSRCVITGHQDWWWNVDVNGKALVLPGGETDFDICHLGPAQEPPNLLIMKKNQYYLVRVIDGHTDIQPFPKSQYEPSGWAYDGLAHVFKFSMIDIRTGAITELKPFDGKFLGISPDGKDIVSVTSGTGCFNVIRTDQQDGRIRKRTVDSAEYAWLGDWSHHVMPVYAPNLWIFSNIRWEKKENQEYEMIVPKTTDLQDNGQTGSLPLCKTRQEAEKHIGKKVQISGLCRMKTFYGKKQTLLHHRPVVMMRDSQEVMIGSLWLEHEKPAESDVRGFIGKRVKAAGTLHGQPPGSVENFPFLCISPVDSVVQIPER